MGKDKQYTPASFTPEELPTNIIASQLISTSFDSQLNKILGAYSFGQLGAIRIGKYSAGVSGEIDITPSGIISINKSNVTTFSLDGTTGNVYISGVLLVGGAAADVNAGSTTINGGKLTTGTVVADTVVSNWVYAGNISAGQITTGSLSASRISGGTLTLGGNNNGNGVMDVKDSSNNTKVYVNNSGITVYGESVFLLDSYGGMGYLSSGNTIYMASVGGKNITIASDNAITIGADEEINLNPNNSKKVKMGGNIDMQEHTIDACDTVWAYNFSSRSDIRVKKNIEDYNIELSDLLKFTPVTYNFKHEEDTKPKHIGFIAQEVEQIIPELVSEDDQGIKSINYSEFSVVLFTALKKILTILDTKKLADIKLPLKSIITKVKESDLPLLVEKINTNEESNETIKNIKDGIKIPVIKKKKVVS